MRRALQLLATGAFILSPLPAGAFEVSGTISASAGTATDSDVNDPQAPYAPNDRKDESQAIPAPVTLGGYLNYPGAGPDGRSKTSGDMVDVFRASLPAGAVVTLFIAEDDGAVHDLDLMLFDVAAPNDPVDSSMGTETTEQVTAPSAGSYYIVAMTAPNADQAATNYLLVVGLDPARSSAPSFRLTLENDLVPGQAIVRFEDTGPRAARASSLAARADSVGLEPLAGAAGREMLFALGQGPARARALGTQGTDPARAVLEAWLPKDAELRERLETLWLIKQLRRRVDVAGANPNYLYQPTATPNDLLYSSQWHYPLIDLPQAWDVTTGSSETVVAVVDTGVLRETPDLQGPLLTGEGSGYDFISDDARSNDGDGIDPDWNDSGDKVILPSSSFHGTHVAGTIAAATDNLIGVSGVNWNARIMPIRVLGKLGGTSYDIQQGLRYAAGLPNDSETVPPRTADIINLSLGGGGSSAEEQDLYNQLRSLGIIVVVAAGNEGNQLPYYPAWYDGVISVSAVGPEKELTPYSNFGRTVDVAAPGGDFEKDIDGDGYVDGVLSTLAEDFNDTISYLYAYSQGTSMACPHMAGVVSLMMALDPELTPDELDALLASGVLTEDLGAPGRDDEYGHGLINALQAVQAVGAPVPEMPELVVTPSSLNFGLAETAATLSVRNAGGGDLSIEEVSNDSVGGWLTVSEADVDEAGLGTYTATVDRGSLPDGPYTATITFESTAGMVDVPVLMQVGSDEDANAGFLYVRLLDVETRETLAELPVAVDGGTYAFSFPNVPGGTYLLGAGGNTDNDSDLCEGGEACGGYPVLNELAPITVDADLSGLDFSASYLSRLPEPSAGSVWLAMSSALGMLAKRRRRQR